MSERIAISAYGIRYRDDATHRKLYEMFSDECEHDNEYNDMIIKPRTIVIGESMGENDRMKIDITFESFQINGKTARFVYLSQSATKTSSWSIFEDDKTIRGVCNDDFRLFQGFLDYVKECGNIEFTSVPGFYLFYTEHP
jgi:hypothetical protein